MFTGKQSMRLENRLRVQREDWASESKKKYGRIFSELYVLLRALDRFFNVENLSLPKEDIMEDIINRNFYDELSAAKDVILKILGILEVVIPESKKNAYWFQKFAQTKILTNAIRDLFRENLYKQDTPEKGLYLLYDSFTNLKGVITELLKSGTISFPCFTNLGQVISKEIRENHFFNPFRKEIDPDFNKIDNRVVSKIALSIHNRETKKYISMLYLYLFMFLRYLSHIDITSERPMILNSSFAILILIRSEVTPFQKYIETAVKLVKDDSFRMLLKSLSYQIVMETKRVYLQELRELLQKKSYQYIRGKIENSQGILENLMEQSILQISQFINSQIQGEDIFESFETRLQQSLKLREDIAALLRFLTLLGEKSPSPKERAEVFEVLKNFMLYFESFTFKLLRYDDYDAFGSFFNDMLIIKKEDILGPEMTFKKILEKIHYFRVFLEMTLRHIENRAELRDRPLDTKRVEQLVKQYYSYGG